jgi:hypothetical protein
VTFTLVSATPAAAICVLHDTRSTPSLPPIETTVPAALTASGPFVCTAAMIAGKFAWMVVVSAAICAEALPVHAKLTVGSVQFACALASLWQLAWQFALALHEGGVTCPVQTGFVYATEHPPWQLPEQLTLAPPVSAQLPVQPPLHVPAQ